ncbi:MAG: isochorismatase, partial [Anaerolineae bacterium]|nr:isochorismatase [Anaerolineae bacterium]
HTLIGTGGHSLTPALYEAIAYHSAARQAQPTFLHKGMIPKTEHYSMLEPEVKVPDVPMGNLNTDFLQMIADHNLIYVAGQAKSHCVLETVNSMMRYYGENHPEVIGKIRILTDCMSSVAHPVIDFEAMAQAAFAAFQKKGLTLVTSTAGIG